MICFYKLTNKSFQFIEPNKMYEENGYGHFAYEDEYDYAKLLRSTQETKFSRIKEFHYLDTSEYYFDMEENDILHTKKPNKYRTGSPTSVIHGVSALFQNSIAPLLQSGSAEHSSSNILMSSSRAAAISLATFSWKRTWNSLLNFIYQVIPITHYKN
jgi:hypothetical protein